MDDLTAPAPTPGPEDHENMHSKLPAADADHECLISRPSSNSSNSNSAMIAVVVGCGFTGSLAFSGLPELYTPGAALLAVSSSTDNLAVGLSLGLAAHPLPCSTNLIVSASNMLGMVVATYGGQLARGVAPQLGAVIAGLIFLGLGLAEIRSYWSEEGLSPLSQLHKNPWLLALPMTLNNLAGGVAAGLGGQPPSAVALLTFLASGVLMALGWLVGNTVATASTSKARGNGAAAWSKVVAGAIFLALGTVQLVSAA